MFVEISVLRGLCSPSTHYLVYNHEIIKNYIGLFIQVSVSG